MSTNVVAIALVIMLAGIVYSQFIAEQKQKMPPALIRLIPAGMLVLAVGPWPYGYYMLLRVIVFAGGLLLAALTYQRVKQFTIWIGLFLIVAIVFNPIVPLHLTREAWLVLDLAGAALFATHWFVMRESATADTKA